MPAKARGSRPASTKPKPAKPTTTPRTTKAKRLADAGFAHVAGWLPRKTAASVTSLIKAAIPTVEELESKARPKGRPATGKAARKAVKRPAAKSGVAIDARRTPRDQRSRIARAEG